jgi:threonine efflux protein
MENFIALVTIAALYLATKASPGPVFFVLTRYSMAGLKRSATMISIGITIGSFSWALLSMAGLSAILASTTWLYFTLKAIGATYLLYLGIALWRTPPDEPSPARRTSGIDELNLIKALRIGLITSFMNPKSGVFWSSVFVVAFPAQAPDWMYGATLTLVGVISFGWHMLLVTLFSTTKVRALYLHAKRTLDRITGTLLVLFGLKLLTDER